MVAYGIVFGFTHRHVFSDRVTLNLQLPQLSVPEAVLTFA
jgi:hypothetical protein